MRKLVKVRDIRNIVKMFNLSEDEEYWLKDITDNINEERNMSRYTTHLTFLMSPACQTLTPERYAAIASMLIYFGIKAQKQVGHLFSETCGTLGIELNADPQWIARIFRGMSYNNPRWNKRVYVADRCGLNVLELK